MKSCSIEAQIRDSSAVTLSLLREQETIAKILDALENTARGGGCIYACGNGGSAADALHLTEELVARYKRERPGIRAQHLCDAALITCWANDYSFESVFERQVQTHLTPQDVLIAFSTSGNSVNVLRAIDAANAIGATSIALLGKEGGAAKARAQISLVVASHDTARIQEAHITLVHILCDALELRLFPKAT